MQEKILSLLKQNKDFISGQQISKELGITRSSVWKYINILKKQGYVIEGISNKGYKLSHSTDMLNLFEITNSLETVKLVKNVSYFQKTSSTNTIAKELAMKGEIDGTLVISETQSKGKGRLNRIWASPKGGIWASLILKPDIEPMYAPKITLIAAAALTLTLKEYNLNIKIKWPNDIILNNKKICGILTEMNCDMDRINYIVLGFGINVNLTKSDIPSDLSTKATSLFIETGKTFDRKVILYKFLENFENLYKELLNTYTINNTLRICKENSILIGKKIIISSRLGKEEALCVDISDNGGLLVKNQNGNLKTILSGDISLEDSYKSL